MNDSLDKSKVPVAEDRSLGYNIEASDGSYSFIDRKDTQINLRGQRLETGEVEHHRDIIRGIAVSMVIRPNGGCYAGELVVVGQMRGSHVFRVKCQPINTSPVQSLSIESIKDHLSETLPAYMWPTAFVEIGNEVLSGPVLCSPVPEGRCYGLP